MIHGAGYPKSDFERFEYESMTFYKKHCLVEENKKFKKVFKDGNGKIKHICF